MDIVSRLGAEAECRRLMTLFNWHVDARDYKSVLSLFVDNCTFVRIDTAHQGKESVMRLLEARPRQRRTRHLLSNVVVDVRDDSSATGRAYCVVYGHHGELTEAEEAPLVPPDSLIHIHTEFLKAAEKWLISKWRIELAFRKRSTETHQ